MTVHLNRVQYRCLIPKCMEPMEGDSPLCTTHLDWHEEYGHPYGKEVNESIDFCIQKGSDKLDAFEQSFEHFKKKGDNKGLSYKRIQQFHIAKAQMIHEKRKYRD